VPLLPACCPVEVVQAVAARLVLADGGRGDDGGDGSGRGEAPFYLGSDLYPFGLFETVGALLVLGSLFYSRLAPPVSPPNGEAAEEACFSPMLSVLFSTTASPLTCAWLRRRKLQIGTDTGRTHARAS
jgi:hypothetical protein